MTLESLRCNREGCHNVGVHRAMTRIPGGAKYLCPECLYGFEQLHSFGNNASAVRSQTEWDSLLYAYMLTQKAAAHDNPETGIQGYMRSLGIQRRTLGA